MNKNECEQVARIIDRVFSLEENISPFTISEVFIVLGNIIGSYEKEALHPPFERETNEFNQACDHKSDGYSYITQHKPQIHSKKCEKCGEFYK
jgi:hypothetical protein